MLPAGYRAFKALGLPRRGVGYIIEPMEPQASEREGLSKNLPGGRVRCLACQRGCVLGDGEPGWCGVRRNEDGRLVALSYGRVAALHPARVERKPLFHFYPGEIMLSAGGLGCNFRCPGCQNRDLSFAPVPEALEEVRVMPPEEFARRAEQREDLGVCWTYNEPAIWFEYTLDGARLARRAGLKTSYVTNGSLTAEALDRIGPHLDAYRVDIKGFSKETYAKVANFPAFRGILEVAGRAKRKWQMHVECVTNVIPTMNDGEEELRGIAGWIAGALGPETPWHVTAFAPQGDLAHLSRTPVGTLERAREIGLEEGLRYVYLGNVPAHPAEDTWCPDCGELLIQRSRPGPPTIYLKEGNCPACGRAIPGRWR